MSESASGEADSSTDGDGKTITVSCPSCDRDFDSTRGMKIHHAQKHGEKLPKGKEYICEWCGEDFRALPSTTHRFCSMSCKDAAHSERMSGKNHPEYTGKETVQCKQCAQDYKVKPSEVEKSTFCSRGCQWQWQRENWNKDDHPASKEYYYIDCEWCGTQMHVKECLKDKRRFCSNECKADWQSEHISGENHPQFDPNSHLNFGPDWDEQAEKCRERDNYRCQACGLPQEEHYRALTVHHKQPRSCFIDDAGNYDNEQANKLSNLITLCSSCHSKYENWPVIPRAI